MGCCGSQAGKSAIKEQEALRLEKAERRAKAQATLKAAQPAPEPLKAERLPTATVPGLPPRRPKNYKTWAKKEKPRNG